jgi:pimeloyl-ACP methyl ester carboxylesterase
VGANEQRYREAERRMWESVGVSPTERRLQLDRTGVEVRVQEVGEGPPVVLVHGASNSGVSWAGLVARLDRFRCIVLDRPGCGLSPPHPTGFGDMAQFEAFSDALVVDVLDALDLERGCVVATSFGGYTALRGAAAHPDRIERMVVFGWSVGAPIAHVPLVMRVSAVPGLGRLMASLPANESAVRMILKAAGLRHALASGKVSQEMIGAFHSLLRDTDTMVNEVTAGPSLLRPIHGFDETSLLSPAVLASIRTPAFFLWGGDDPFGGAEVARAFTAQIPGAELELMAGAGHAVWIDDPERAAKTVDTFLRG